MAYIRKNVNLFLLLLVIIILGAFAALTTYYQTTYKSLSLSYGDKLAQLNAVNSNLSVQGEQLRQLNDELKIKTEVKEKFDILYSNISEYNEKLTEDYARTKAELFDALDRMKRAESELATAKSELNTTQGALKTQLDYTRQLEGQVSGLRTEVCSLRQRLNETC